MFAFNKLKYKVMETEKEKELLDLKNNLLHEIQYRETVLEELKRSSKTGKGFYSFIKLFLKINKEPPNLFWLSGETYGRYLIEQDKELHENIAKCFEKSIEKLKSDYLKIN